MTSSRTPGDFLFSVKNDATGQGTSFSLGDKLTLAFRGRTQFWIVILPVLFGGLLSCAGSKAPLPGWPAQPDSSFVSALRADVETDSTNPLAWQRLGVAEYRQGDLTVAATDLERARRAEPQNPVTLFFLGRTEDQIERPDLADGHFTDVDFEDGEPHALEVESWIRDRRWNRELDQQDLDRTTLVRNPAQWTLHSGQVLVPDFLVEAERAVEGETLDGPGNPAEARSIGSLVRSSLPELAIVLADDAIFAFALREQERRRPSDLDRVRWGRMREVGALGVRSFDRDAAPPAVDPEQLRERGERLLRATGASSILQGVLRFDGSSLNVQWVWIELGVATLIGSSATAPVDSLGKLIVGLAEDLGRDEELRTRIWNSFTDSAAVAVVSQDPDSDEFADLVGVWAPGRSAKRLERVRARRSELERQLDRAAESYGRLLLLDPTDQRAGRGIDRVSHAAVDLELAERSLWASLESDPDVSVPVESSPPPLSLSFRSFLVDDVAASLSPGPLPDRSGKPVAPREDHLGSDPMDQWIPLGQRTLEPGIGDFPDPPRRSDP